MTDVRVAFPGGLGEFGMNMALVDSGADLFAVDCGLMFPENDMPGVDVVIPDVGSVFTDPRFRGVVLTHGHEDHLGALPYLLREHHFPVWGSRYTLALLRARAADKAPGAETDFREYRDGETFPVGECSITPVFMTHSIFDAHALAVDTPGGRLFFSGDFKFDQTPPDGRLTNLSLLSRIGDEGVDLLFSDSTNALTEGYGPSEAALAPVFDGLLAEHGGRIHIALFSSNMLRVKLIADLCRKRGKRLCLVGRSLLTAYQAAVETGLLKLDKDLLVNVEKLRGHARHSVVVAITGTQGEPFGSLSRLAHGELKGVTLEEGDTVVFSARIIPGNERPIFRLMDQFCRAGARVLTERNARVHVSGHAWRDELRMMLRLLRPRHFVPVHGTFSHLHAHRELAVTAGVPLAKTLLVEAGEAVRLRDGRLEHAGEAPCDKLYIDSDSELGVGEDVLRDRRHMAEDGLVVPVIIMNRHTGELEMAPELLQKGVASEPRQSGLAEDAMAHLREVLGALPPHEAQDLEFVEATAIRELKRFYRKRLQKKPLVLPKVLEV